MFKNFKLGAVVAYLGGQFAYAIKVIFMGSPMVRSRTVDVAFTYRMGAGFAGDINRTHPFSSLPGLTNVTNPPRRTGDGMLVDTATNSYRGFIAGDASATPVALGGVHVRSFPTQQTTAGMTADLGVSVPPTSGVLDVLRSGYIMVQIPPGVAVTKNGPVWVWCVATSGANRQGAFAGAASTGNTVPINNARFMGPADPQGVAELEVWMG